jgi:prepilin-type N-terminal cleavage/methylation domain-containing protein
MNTFKQPARGFTLVELAMSLLVIGLLMGTLILPVTGQLNARAIDETVKTMENIKEALIGYAMTNNKLPCPAAVVSNPAVNDLGTSQSTLCGQEGFLPWAELGIGKVTDAWGFPIRYRVDSAYTTAIPSDLKTTSNITVSHDTGSGNINLVSPEADNTSKIIVLLLSYGNDHAANGTQAQQGSAATPYENGDGNTAYVANDYINGSNAASNFDDIVTWLPKTTLLARLAAANRYNYSTSP